MSSKNTPAKTENANRVVEALCSIFLANRDLRTRMSIRAGCNRIIRNPYATTVRPAWLKRCHGGGL